jgi:capsular exopolysaccharide synthesis family protein
LKRAAANSNGATPKKAADGADAPTNGHRPPNGNGGGGDDTHAAQSDAPDALHAAASPGGLPEHLLRSSRFFNVPETAHVSASIEHTERASGGSALPAGQASRDAGATLGAVGSTRTPEFVSLDISAARVEPHLVAITQPRSPHAERYRSLRTRVLHASERKKLQAFVITSAGIMEGKTLTSINLSWLLAQTDGTRALLIDGDLRQPCAAEYLGIEAPVGLSEVLNGEASLAETIIRLDPSGLHLLPGGSARDNVAEILSGPKFSAVLTEVRKMFDFIVIDAPPLGIFTDANVLINRADGALIVARSGKTRYAALDRVLEALPRERLLGVVLNDSSEQLSDNDYYYQRRYVRRDEPQVTTKEPSRRK